MTSVEQGIPAIKNELDGEFTSDDLLRHAERLQAWCEAQDNSSHPPCVHCGLMTITNDNMILHIYFGEPNCCSGVVRIEYYVLPSTDLEGDADTKEVSMSGFVGFECVIAALTSIQKSEILARGVFDSVVDSHECP